MISYSILCSLFLNSHTTKASVTYPKLTGQSCHQNAQASPDHSHPQITPLATNLIAKSLKSLITSLQLPKTLSPQLPSRDLHHTSIRSTQSSFCLTITGHYMYTNLRFLQPNRIQHCTASLERSSS